MDMVILPQFEAALAHAIFGADGLDAVRPRAGRQIVQRRAGVDLLPDGEPRRAAVGDGDGRRRW